MERNPSNPQKATRRRGTWDLSQVQVTAVLKCQLCDLGQTTNLPVSASVQGKEEQHPPLDVMRAKRKRLPQSTSSRDLHGASSPQRFSAVSVSPRGTSGNVWRPLQLGEGRSYWYLVGRGQGCCYRSTMHRTGSLCKEYPGPNVNGSE